MGKEEIKQVDLSAVNKIIDSTFYEAQKLISYEIAYRRCKIKECIDRKDDGSAYYHVLEIDKLRSSRIDLKLLYGTLESRLTFENER